LQTKESYHIGPFTLDSVAKQPINTLEALKKYDLAIIAKPTEAFSESEKQVLDQYIVDGGKTIWLIDQVVAEMDSLYSPTGSAMAFSRDLNLNDFFFKYGVRIYPDLVKGEKDGEEYQRVYYNGLIGILVKEVQDLKRRLAALE
jgi:gliding-associated putative ABC transporter substrate-binding component GldG